MVIAGISHNSLRETLDSIFSQPGINNQIVYVSFDEKFPEYKDLINLYKFKAIIIRSSTSYIDLIAKSLQECFSKDIVKIFQFHKLNNQ